MTKEEQKAICITLNNVLKELETTATKIQHDPMFKISDKKQGEFMGIVKSINIVQNHIKHIEARV